MNVKVQIDPRKDGRYTATIKLVAWDLNRLRGLIQNMTMTAFGRDIGREVGQKLVESINAPQPQVEEEEERSIVDVIEEMFTEEERPANG
jgi:hypothetical protein